MTQMMIMTPDDRTAHIEQCKTGDAEWRAEHGGNIPSDRHYENVGDIATINDWYYHDENVGYVRLYTNTPVWIVEIAINRCWISERGERVRQ